MNAAHRLLSKDKKGCSTRPVAQRDSPTILPFHSAYMGALYPPCHERHRHPEYLSISSAVSCPHAVTLCDRPSSCAALLSLCCCWAASCMIQQADCCVQVGKKG